MAIHLNLDDLVKYSTSGSAESIWVMKDARVAGAAANASNSANEYTSLWQYEGQPSHGAVPGAASNPTNTTTGSLIQTNPGAGSQKWLQYMFAGTSLAGTVILYDRLMHMGGLDGTVTTAQTVSGSVSRYTGTESIGNEIWVEVYTLIGTNTQSITVNYKNQDGTDKTTTSGQVGGSTRREAQRMIPIPLAPGDVGVRSIDSVTLGGSTATAGNFGINIIRPLYLISNNNAGKGNIRSYMDGPIPEIKSGACLAFMFNSSTAAATNLVANCFFVDR